MTFSEDPRPFEDILLFEYYGFNVGVHDVELRTRTFDRLEANTWLWLASSRGARVESRSQDVNTNRSILNALHKFDNRSLYPEFRTLERSTHYLIPGFTYEDEEHHTVEVVLTLHKSGVGTVLMHPTKYESCTAAQLKQLAVRSHRVPKNVTCSDKLLRILEQTRLSAPARASLDQMFLLYLRALSPTSEGELLTANSITVDADDADPLAEAKVNRYQFVTIEGVPASADLDQFVQEHRDALVDAAEAYSWHAGPNFSFCASRRQDVVHSCFPRDSSVRRHLRYQMNSYRILAVSSIHSHPQIYKYDTAPWFSGYLGMIELVLSQFEVLYLLHGELWKRLGTRDDLVMLQERSYESLLDFLNARIIDHPQGRKFVRKLSETLHVEEYYQVIKERLGLAQIVASERHKDQEQRVARALDRQTRDSTKRGNRLQGLAVALAVVFSLQFAETFVSHFVMPILDTADVRGPHLERLAIGLLWLLVLGAVFWGLRHIEVSSLPAKDRDHDESL